MRRSGFTIWVCLLAVRMNSVLADDAVTLGVRGGSVEFPVQMSLAGLDIDYLFWRFNSTSSVLRYSNESKNPLKTYDEYEGRVGLDPLTYTLTLTDLQASDNGVFSARITDHKGYEKDVAKHTLNVHEAVPELVFSVSLLYFNASEGFCNVSVACAAGSSGVRATCDLSQCSQEETQLRMPHLRMGLSLREGRVYCNASNLVSVRSEWGRMEDVCTEEVVSPPMESILGPLLIVLDAVTPFFLIFLILFCLIKRRRHTGYYDRFTTKAQLKRKFASIELLNIREFEELCRSTSSLELPSGNLPSSPPLPRGNTSSSLELPRGNTSSLELPRGNTSSSLEVPRGNRKLPLLLQTMDSNSAEQL